MTVRRQWVGLGVLGAIYLIALGFLVGTMTERFRFDDVRARVVTQLEDTIRQARADTMAREVGLHPEPSASATTETTGSRRPSVWRGYIEMVDAALAEQKVPTAVRAWREAHAAAIRTRAWRPLVEVGDALMRISVHDGRREAYVAQARKTYMAALTRARADRSIDGVLRVAEAFAALGDQGVAEECLTVAQRLGASADHEVIVRVRALGQAVDSGTGPPPQP
jgi:hypothetical protein